MEPGDVAVDQLALDPLVTAVTTLLAGAGTARDEQLWSYFDGCVFPVKPLQTHELLKLNLANASRVLGRLKATKDALGQLTESCERRISTLERKMRPSFLYYGIHTITDDVLLYIFELIVNERLHLLMTGTVENYIPPELSLSQVCRRFRSLVTNTPTLWGGITSTMTEQCIRQHLDLSRGAPLTLSICDTRWDCRFDKLFELIVPHTERWKSFKLDLYWKVIVDPSYAAGLKRYLDNLVLPNLEDLFIFHFNEELPENYDYDFDSFDFYKTWKTPKIRHVFTRQTILSLALSHIPADSITTFEFEWVKEDFNLRRLLGFLVTLVNLNTLHVDVNFCNLVEDTLRIDDIRGSFSAIRRLFIKTCHLQIFSAILRHLQMPSLEALTLIGHIGPSTVEEWLNCIPSGTFQSVKELEFGCRNGDRDTFDVNVLFELFPGLRKLEIDTPCNLPVIEDTEAFVPSLRSVALTLGLYDLWRFVRDLVTALEINGEWGTFEYFEFRPPGSTDKHKVEYITQNKVKWTFPIDPDDRAQLGIPIFECPSCELIISK